MSSFDVTLLEGLNSISIPLILDSSSKDIATVFSGIQITKVIRIEDGVYQYYIPGRASTLNDFTTLDHLHGYIVELGGNTVTLEITISQPGDYTTANLDEGDTFYTDEAYIITTIPDSFENLKWIKTENADVADATLDHLQFTINKDSTIYVAFDENATSLPDWLDDFTSTGKQIVTDAGEFDVYEKYYEKGAVQLGGASAVGAAGVTFNYFVLLKGSPNVQTVTFTGSEPSGILDIPINGTKNDGVNLIGFPKKSNDTIANVLDARNLQYSHLFRLKAGIWESYVKDRASVLNWSSSTLERGRGYMLVSNKDQILEIEYDS